MAEKTVESEARKRILFVGKNYYPGRAPEDFPLRDNIHPGIRDFYDISESLEEKCDVETRFDLTELVFKIIEQRKNTEMGYDVLITHVPYKKGYTLQNPVTASLSRQDFYSYLYKDSLDILRRIKENNPELPILAYTGADKNDIVIDLFRDNGPIDEIVFKLAEWQADLVEIKIALNKLCQAGFEL